MQSRDLDEPTRDEIVRNVRRVIIERKGAGGKARRDVHVKHHGCVWGWFRIDPNLPEELRHGAFVPGKTYRVWIRFSSSSKKLQSDTVDDGRGIAIKLLEVNGQRGLQDPDAQTDTQDFIMLNGPAFFARDAAEMAIVADLEARDEFPSMFFVDPKRFRGLTALLQMVRNQADSPLDLTYFSQTPYKLGDDRIVKYRLRPVASSSASSDEVPGGKGPHYLFEALKRRLEPSQEERVAIQNSAAFDPGPNRDVLFRFEVQVATHPTDCPIDDATVVWNEDIAPFKGVAELRIPRQEFDGLQRMAFAERMSFNPWNCHVDHLPLGSLNEARLYAYRASLQARTDLNRSATEPPPPALTYTTAEWENLRREAGGPRWSPPRVYDISSALRRLQSFDALFPNAIRAVANLMSSKWGFLIAPVFLAAIVAYATLINKTALCGPLMFGSDMLMPSDRLIPPAIFSSGYRDKDFEKKLDERMQDIEWVFRYAPVGAEFTSGIPYWIFRVLPRMFPENFGYRGDWSLFGFQPSDDSKYYESYHELPRGLVMSDTVIHLGGNGLGIRLKRVSLNCASCHRGEVIDENGQSSFFNGMPNIALDTAEFKRSVFRSLTNPRFVPEKVIDEINRVLADEHARRPKLADGTSTPHELSWAERLAYGLIVKKMQEAASSKSIAWIDRRPRNGPGRLDAFGALRFEFLNFPLEPANEPPKYLATVDLPSVWNQSSAWRPWHHYDGNTDDSHARNVGAIVGIGGRSFSIHDREVVRIGHWIDNGLEQPDYPFPSSLLQLGDPDQGHEIYEKKSCPRCHGSYAKNSAGKYRILNKGTSAVGSLCDVGTDPMRAELVDAPFVEALNAFGMKEGLWHAQSFRYAGKYLCPPLDGIWARAPYLHNGSVPTLWHLLAGTKRTAARANLPELEQGKERRPTRFVRGNPAYDQMLGGFEWSGGGQSPSAFTFDTSLPGNSNQGHDDPDSQVVLDIDERKKVIAFLLSL